MSWKRKSGAMFTGGSGQMAVIAELLLRQCNAAVPHVDVGTDVFAMSDDREDVARIQVKTARANEYKKDTGYRASYDIPMGQLKRTDKPPLFYALAVRKKDGWGAFLIISRNSLQTLWNEGCGSENRESGNLQLVVQYRAEGSPQANPIWTANCGVFDLSKYLEAWETLPPLMQPEEIASPPQA
jgi:hypothetical protein